LWCKRKHRGGKTAPAGHSVSGKILKRQKDGRVRIKEKEELAVRHPLRVELPRLKLRQLSQGAEEKQPEELKEKGYQKVWRRNLTSVGGGSISGVKGLGSLGELGFLVESGKNPQKK